MTFAALLRQYATYESRCLRMEAVKPLLAGILACAAMAVVGVIAAITVA